MGKLNVAVSTKLSDEDYLLLKKVTEAEFENGNIREPTTSRMLRRMIRAKIKKWREANPHTTDDNKLREASSCYYTSST